MRNCIPDEVDVGNDKLKLIRQLQTNSSRYTMTPERWQDVKDIFHSALEIDPAQREAFLDKACAGHDSLRREVELLIQSHEQPGSFLETAAIENEAAARILVNDNPKLSAGQRIGHYEIVTLLGEGGMGEVYLAEDTKLGRKVALKFLPSYFTKDEERLRRFAQEARAASALNQPNILTIHEIGEADGHRFIATEFIDGETLRQRLASGPLKLGEALNIAEQVASALATAHAEGIIHRDIKPENIMLRRDALVKVLDFGLAKLTEQKQSGPEDATRELVQTSVGAVMGTVGYMSPEQARGLAVDARTDIWSLGVVLYEMLAGSAPFAGETSSDVLVEILEREPKSLESFSTGTPESLDWIVTKALTKNRDDRYQTARELLADIKRLAHRLSFASEMERSIAPEFPGKRVGTHDRGTNADATSVAERSGRSNRGMRWTRLLLFAVAIALAAGLILWRGSASWFKRASPAGPPVVVLMDSPVPERVYDPETRKKGGTNADDITDILRDLPIIIEKENTSSLWHREDQVLRQHPNLIVLHRSCFADADVGFDPQSNAMQTADSKIGGFLGYISLGNPVTKFLVYTRRSDDQTAWASDLEKRFPHLKGRVFTMTIPGGSEHASFRDPETMKMLKAKVQSILGLR
ncbi:MAG: serine/threonine-protein kinase [Pyrinomonadaceae bacterium]